MKITSRYVGLPVVASLLLATAGPALAQDQTASTDSTAVTDASGQTAAQLTPAVAQAEVQTAYGSSIKGKTQVERAIGKCTGSIVGGAILGALVGAAAKDTGTGALIGAAAGAGLCAYLLVVASKQDKQALRDAQLQAINSGQTYQTTWTTTDGKPAAASVQVSPIVQVSAPKTKETLRCRRARTTLAVADAPQSFDDAVCLVGDTWVTGKDLKEMGINDSDVKLA